MRQAWLGLTLLLACASNPAQAQLRSPLPRLLRADTARFGRVLRAPARYRLQILYTRIDRDAQNRPHFRTFRYRVRPRQYFYPASTVKLPAAVLALQKMRALRPQVPGLSLDSPLRIDSAFAGQTPVLRDTSSATGRASIGQYIRKVLLVSDNDGFNRLYEFMGQGALNAELRGRGLRHTRLIHRLSVGDQEPGSRHTNPLAFFADTTLQRPLYVQPAAYNGQALPRLRLRGEQIGKAYMQGEKLVAKPMDFSRKNYFSLADQQQVLRAVLFPEAMPPRQRFALAADDYQFLYRYLSMHPRESRAPRYDAAHYPDTYAKFLLGGGGTTPLPPGVRVFNKIGQAYGFLIDNAYVADFDHGVEFLLSAVLYVNADEVLNDDKYEYDTVGFPFLRDLGQAVYQYELTRPRRHRPDLSRFKIDYARPDAQ
ncbi:Beta-lactamase enzyme family protein [Hymenobacter daecheongensis DSM 21074]|uniref:Beta-lactamase enzyme family protein n=1 Tax=Hymenobacter daecheongensis DSM 21074 TaxID=1121955 RepID=A0A1M6LPY6_9BACT|nr:serine hydrolase [Hymenobacter daecheongensis]SHJ73263.1 Beta-lactamase enzyme family protein [Hymenobacter daecheongensis DSM 21074]